MGVIPTRRMFEQRPPSALDAMLASPQAEESPTSDALPTTIDDLADRFDRPLTDAVDSPLALNNPATDFPTQQENVPRGRLSFEELYSQPENKVFKVVFFPDRIFHAQYLNASRVPYRYRYAVTDARSILDVTVLKARLFMDGQFATNLLRIEYRGSRLMEQSRENGRFMREQLIAWVKINGHDDGGKEISVSHPVKLQYCPWIDSYQVELWETLEPPSRSMRHDFQITTQMGPTGPINRAKSFSPLLKDINSIKEVELAFRENDIYEPYGRPIEKPNWDNNYERSYQVPHSPMPNAHSDNTVLVNNYMVSFQKGWFINAEDVPAVRYRNAMMDADNPEHVSPDVHPELNDPSAWKGLVQNDSFAKANVIEMKWLLQRELGGSVVFFHEVTIPPGTVEGTHQHIGSEEVYYIVSGKGVAYMASGDDPKTEKYPKVMRQIYGLFDTECVELPVGPGNVIFTKSGGMHGIKNASSEPLKFVAFLYHSI